MRRDARALGIIANSAGVEETNTDKRIKLHIYTWYSSKNFQVIQIE